MLREVPISKRELSSRWPPSDFSTVKINEASSAQWTEVLKNLLGNLGRDENATGFHFEAAPCMVKLGIE